MFKAFAVFTLLCSPLTLAASADSITPPGTHDRQVILAAYRGMDAAAARGDATGYLSYCSITFRAWDFDGQATDYWEHGFQVDRAFRAMRHIQAVTTVKDVTLTGDRATVAVEEALTAQDAATFRTADRIPALGLLIRARAVTADWSSVDTWAREGNGWRRISSQTFFHHETVDGRPGEALNPFPAIAR